MRSSTPVLTTMVLWVGLTAGAGARADDSEAPGMVVAELANPTRGAIPGAGSNDAPRLVRSDSPAEPQRSLPGYRSESTELSYRWWLSTGRADLGLGLGTLAYVNRPTGSIPGLGADNGVIASGTVLTVGMRYRTSKSSAIFADAASWRAAGLNGGDAVAGKVGIEFKAAQSRWNVAYGGLGLHLDGNTRMSLRVRRGGLAVFMRSTF